MTKELLGTIAVILTFVGYVPYVRDILKGKTHPHIYSWFLWGLITIIIFALQMSDHAGPGAFVTLTAGVLCFFVLVLGIKFGKKDITKLDTYLLVLTLIAVCVWLFAKQPLFSVILATLADLLAFIPTVRKSWNKPFSETLAHYQINSFRFILAILALSHYTVITALYPVTWMVANALFALVLVLRRRAIGHGATQ